MNPSYRSQTERILRECTTNDSHAREFASSAWYIFEPGLYTCQEAMRLEQDKVDAERALLRAPRTQVSKTEVERLYIPITAKLGADRTNRGASYPEYHRLFKGGVQQNKLVFGLVFGMIDHDTTAGPSADFNWGELMTALDLVMTAHGEFKPVAGPDTIDLARFQLAGGRVIANPSFKDLVKLKTGGSSLRLSSAESTELQKLFAARIYKKWLVVEKTTKVRLATKRRAISASRCRCTSAPRATRSPTSTRRRTPTSSSTTGTRASATGRSIPAGSPRRISPRATS